MALDRDSIHFGVSGQTHGPVDVDTIREMLRDGRLHTDDYLWDPDLEDWISIRRYPFLLSEDAVGDDRADATPSGAPPPLWSVAIEEAPAPRERGWAVPLGGLGARGLAWFIDLLVLLVPVMLLESYLQGRYDIDWSTFWIPFLEQYLGLDAAARTSAIVLSEQEMATGLRFLRELQIGTIVLRAIYWTLLESSRLQATFGKRLMGLLVTDVAARRITLSRAALRFAGRLLCEFTFGMGYLVMLFTERRQGLHDLIARTLVLKR